MEQKTGIRPKAYERRVMAILNLREREPPIRAKATCGQPTRQKRDAHVLDTVTRSPSATYTRFRAPPGELTLALTLSSVRGLSEVGSGHCGASPSDAPRLRDLG
jgi:hypothetical protein